MLSNRQIQMLTKQGFAALFWSDLAARRKKNPAATHEEVYETLEREYITGTGQRRYANFNAFRRRRDER